jgi:hypothetical protein
MSTAPTRPNGHAAAPATAMDALELALVNGDLSKLSPEQRLAYYRSRCEAAGLDPRTQPFQYITLSGRLTLYATKAATDQLIAARKLSVAILRRGYDEGSGCYEVECRVTFPDGQAVDDLGVLSIHGLKGEALANAIMKTTTKAKRRTVLSACGLGMLDESEVETIPQARVERAPEPPRKAIEPPRAEPEPSISDCRRWIQDRLDRANADWATTCALSHKDYKPLCNLHQCVNGIMSLWLEDGVVYPDAVETDGKRDKTKVASMLKDMWAEDEMEVKDAVEGYLRSKEEEAAKAAGINLDSTPAEPEPAEATADA